jgi:hypothetical protein
MKERCDVIEPLGYYVYPELNKLVDEHNQKINTFNTKEENETFHLFMVDEINSRIW